jgi:hypothetical protein
MIDYRASSAYGTNPYERKIIRALWEMQGLPEVVPWLDAPTNRVMLVAAYADAAQYACPDWPRGRCMEWAEQRYTTRRNEVRRHHGLKVPPADLGDTQHDQG